MNSVKAECQSCSGTGLYSGMCEAEGTAVICRTCDGTGCETIRYKPYAGRKRKRGIKTISRSRGSFILTGVGAVGPEMTYHEFEQKFPEPRS